MLPDEPNFSTLTELKEFPTYNLVRPEKPTEISFVGLGPVQLNDPSEALISAYWAVYQKDSEVYITKSTGASWEESVRLFTESLLITEFALTFDQLGRPAVFFATEQGNLYLHWYNPITNSEELLSVGEGKHPYAAFDVPEEPSEAYSDMMLFFNRGDVIYRLLQRDRWAVEYTTTATGSDIAVVMAGISVEGRFQVETKVRDSEPIGFQWNPETPATVVWEKEREID